MTTTRKRTAAARKKKNPREDTLVDIGRAAELLGYSHNGILKAIDNGTLKTRTQYERRNGRTAPLIRLDDLERFRLRIVARCETMTGDNASERLLFLRALKVFA